MRFSTVLLLTFACAITSSTPTTRRSLELEADAALAEMKTRAPGLDGLLEWAAGYAVFPNVGAAGSFVAGGASGRGLLYEQGQPTGYVELKQGSIGFQVGGQTYAELIVLRDHFEVDRLKSGTFELGAGASAVVLQTGAADATTLARDSTIFVMPHGGLVVGVTVTGQTVAFRPAG